MRNDNGQINGGDIQKPYEPDVTKGLTVTNAPPKPTAPQQPSVSPQNDSE